MSTKEEKVIGQSKKGSNELLDELDEMCSFYAKHLAKMRKGTAMPLDEDNLKFFVLLLDKMGKIKDLSSINAPVVETEKLTEVTSEPEKSYNIQDFALKKIKP